MRFSFLILGSWRRPPGAQFFLTQTERVFPLHLIQSCPPQKKRSTSKIQRHQQIKFSPKTESFNKLTKTREADEKDQTKEKCALEKITACRFAVEGHTENCVERCCEPAKNVSSLQQMATNTLHTAQPITIIFPKIMKQPEKSLPFARNLS